MKSHYGRYADLIIFLVLVLLVLMCALSPLALRIFDGFGINVINSSKKIVKANIASLIISGLKHLFLR